MILLRQVFFPIFCIKLIYFERKSYGEGEILHPVVHSTSDLSRWGRAKQKPEETNFISLPDGWQRSDHLASPAFPRTSVGSWAGSVAPHVRCRQCSPWHLLVLTTHRSYLPQTLSCFILLTYLFLRSDFLQDAFALFIIYVIEKQRDLPLFHYPKPETVRARPDQSWEHRIRSVPW